MDYIIKLVNKIKDGFTGNRRVAFVFSMIAGILAHGYGMANNYMYHDATILNELGATFTLGRWALGFAGKLNDLVLGNFNLPYINMVVSLLFIAMSAMNVVEILEVKNKATAAFIGALMSVYPVVTSSNAYNFTVLYYFAALLLVTYAVKVMKKGASVAGLKPFPVKDTIVAALLLALSAGFYQAYLSVAVTLFLALLILELYRENENVVSVLIRGVKYAVSSALGLVFYLVFNKLTMVVMHQSMMAYQGAEDFGKLEIAKLPGRLVQSYLHFFYIKWNGINSTKGQWVLVALGVGFAAIVIAFELIKKDTPVINKAAFVVLCVCLPIAVNLEYLFSTSDNYSVHTLMRYATAFVLIIPIVLIEEKRNAITNISELALIAIAICYIFADNVAYVKMSLVQEETTAYFAVLESRIVSLDGYSDDTPVIFVGEFGKDDNYLTRMCETLPQVSFLGYEYNARDIINKESWYRYMRIHTGYEPYRWELNDDIKSTEEFQGMTNYPDAGSVKMINGAAVVKFSDNY